MNAGRGGEIRTHRPSGHRRSAHACIGLRFPLAQAAICLHRTPEAHKYTRGRGPVVDLSRDWQGAGREVGAEGAGH